jgi:hypothetical protein
VSFVQNIHANKHNVTALSNRENPISYTSRAFNQSFPTIKLKCVLSKEIEDVTKSLKMKNSHEYDETSTNQVFTTSLLL